MATIEEALAHAVGLHRAGRVAEAEAIYRRMLQVQPEHADALHLLGVIARSRGQADQAAALIGQALRVRPHFPEAWFNLGNALRALNRRNEAVTAFRNVLALNPDFAGAHYNLALALQFAGQNEAAVEHYRHAAARNPHNPDIHANLGATLHGLSRFDEAIDAYRAALALRPDFPEVHANLGASLYSQGYLDEAVAAFRTAVERRPDYAKAHSNLLMCLNYDAKAGNAEVFAAHLAWAERHGRPPAGGIAPHGNDRDPERPLRIGYVSPDFVKHPVGYFFYAALLHRDRARSRVVAYSVVQAEDEMTGQIRELVDDWRPIFGLSAEDIARQVRADGIDILVDLAGHTAGHRLAVFALKPAPVQATWLGYPNTTGMDAIDYRLTDEIADPSGFADPVARETLVRLPHGFLCYVPMTAAPEVAPAPALGAGHVTFGSLNNVAKVTPEVAAVWAEILHRVPGSRLLLKSKQLTDPAVRERYRARFTVHGIAPERLELIGWTPSIIDHFALYHRMDIALDPFPYNGTTTTCDALWMGVPVVTWAWDRHAGRVGASLLNRVGLSELVAPSRAAYVELAAGLARDPARLAALRAGIRPRMAASPLCDARAFAAALDAAYRRMWWRWCRTVP